VQNDLSVYIAFLFRDMSKIKSAVCHQERIVIINVIWVSRILMTGLMHWKSGSTGRLWSLLWFYSQLGKSIWKHEFMSLAMSMVPDSIFIHQFQ